MAGLGPKDFGRPAEFEMPPGSHTPACVNRQGAFLTKCHTPFVLMNDLGKIAYEAYCKERNYISFNGERLPHFEEQSTDLQNAWRKAAQKVAEHISLQTSPG